MNRKLMLGIGAMLVVVGAAALASSVLGLLFDFRIRQLWPFVVIIAGLLVTAPAVFAANRWKLVLLYVPGLPIVTTGVLLLFASVLRWWDVWSILWPLELLSVAAGFCLAGIKTKAQWLLIPAILIGTNGLILQFCAATGWWHAWAVLWAVEPVAIGISLLTINTRHPSKGLLTTGLALCAIGSVGAMESMAIVSLSALRPLWRLWRWPAPIILILTGVVLIFWSLARNTTFVETASPAETQPNAAVMSSSST